MTTTAPPLASRLTAAGLQQRGQIFRLLVLFRWLSLIPAGLALLAEPSPPWGPLLPAVLITASITMFSARVNRWLVQWPQLLLLDILIAVAFLWFTGAEYSPFLLYSLTPLLAAAFFFGTRGGLIAAATCTALYLPIVYLAPRPGESMDLPVVAIQVLAFFLISAVVGYASLLLESLQKAHSALTESHDALAQRNRDLHLIQELTLILQSSVDPVELEEYIVQGLVNDMGYRRAVIGLYDEGQQVLSSWLTQEASAAVRGDQQLAHTERIQLDQAEAPLARALRSREPLEILDGRSPSGHRGVHGRLAAGRHYLILPLTLRENPLGVLLVDQLPGNGPLSEGDRNSLERLAAHAGVALGSVRLCINRAQREAVVEERNRIAADLHDSISQVLYGLAYGLDACIQLLPGQPQAVQAELEKLHPVVVEAQAQMRRAIFDMHSHEIAADSFSARLHRHLDAICPARSLALRIELPGEFNRWQPEVRYDLYRVAQEAMTNAARHAAAERILITVAEQDGQCELRVEDDGRGFSSGSTDTANHLGIQSMSERVRRRGGDLHIERATTNGTVVVARIPTAGLPAPEPRQP